MLNTANQCSNKDNLNSVIFSGTSANAENFQMYVLEGIARWNVDRALDKQMSVATRNQSLCYNHLFINTVSKQSEELLEKSLPFDLPKLPQLSTYTGEIFVQLK